MLPRCSREGPGKRRGRSLRGGAERLPLECEGDEWEHFVPCSVFYSNLHHHHIRNCPIQELRKSICLRKVRCNSSMNGLT